MGFLVSFTLLLSAFYYTNKDKIWSSPEALFCFEWSIITFLASIRLFGLFSVSIKTWLIIIVGTVSYLLGSWIGRHIHLRNNYLYQYQGINSKPLFKPTVFWVLFLLILIYHLGDLVQTIHFLQLGYSLDDVRHASIGELTINNYVRRTGIIWESLDLIIATIELFIVAFSISEFVFNMKKNYSFLLATIVVEIVKAITYGGRFGIAYFVVEILVCSNVCVMLGRSQHIHFSPKLKRAIGTIVACMLVLIIVLSLMRGALVSDLAKKYYRYLCGNIVFFDLHISKMTFSSFWSYGFAGLYGLWAVILPVLNLFGVPYPKAYLDTIEIVMDGQTFRQIGTDLYTNAFITPFYYLYSDFRIIGVIVGMLAFGLFAGYIFKRMTVLRDNTSILAFLIVTQMVFKTLQLYPLSNKSYFLAFLAMALLFRLDRFKLAF